MNAVASTGSHRLSHDELLATIADGLRSAQGSLALLLVDLQDPLDLHTQVGFEASAALVNNLAESFRLALGGRGTVVQFSDASCCILIDAVHNSGHARLAAEKLVRAADSTIAAGGLAFAPGLNIGIALHPRDAVEPQALLRKAQLASAAARKRDQRIVVYDEACSAQVLKSAELGVAYSEALETGALAVHYQPKVRIADGSLAGVEALLRWLQNGTYVATPDVFIALAEQSRLIHDTTWYALSNSLRTSAAFSDLGVAVNITPSMLHHREFVEMIETAVHTLKVKPGVLTLELTEGALIADFAEATSRLKHARELGVRVSIDDFGTGYSSLSYFKKIPADEIKIDKSFVMRMLTDKADQRLVQAIITLAHQFDLAVVAEGVENAESLEALSAFGCDYAQGFHFAPALDLERLRTWVDEYCSRNGRIG